MNLEDYHKSKTLILKKSLHWQNREKELSFDVLVAMVGNTLKLRDLPSKNEE